MNKTLTAIDIMVTKIFRFSLFCFLVLAHTSCWRMPEDGEVSTLPNINNPQITRQQDAAPMPTDIGY